MTKAQIKIISRLADGKDCGCYPCSKCPFKKARNNPNLCPQERLLRIAAKMVLELGGTNGRVG